MYLLRFLNPSLCLRIVLMYTSAFRVYLLDKYQSSQKKIAMISCKLVLVSACILLAIHRVGRCFALTYVDSNKDSYGLCLTSKDNLLNYVDPRKLFKFMDEMNAFKTKLLRTKTYFQYCAKDLKIEIEGFVKWVDYVIKKIDLEVALTYETTHLIHQSGDNIEGVRIEMNVHPPDPKIIKKALKELETLRKFLPSSDAFESVDKLKEIYEVDEMFGKFGWLRKLYCKLRKIGESSEEVFTRPTLD